MLSNEDTQKLIIDYCETRFHVPFAWLTAYFDGYALRATLAGLFADFPELVETEKIERIRNIEQALAQVSTPKRVTQFIRGLIFYHGLLHSRWQSALLHPPIRWYFRHPAEERPPAQLGDPIHSYAVLGQSPDPGQYGTALFCGRLPNSSHDILLACTRVASTDPKVRAQITEFTQTGLSYLACFQDYLLLKQAAKSVLILALGDFEQHLPVLDAIPDVDFVFARSIRTAESAHVLLITHGTFSLGIFDAHTGSVTTLESEGDTHLSDTLTEDQLLINDLSPGNLSHCRVLIQAQTPRAPTRFFAQPSLCTSREPLSKQLVSWLNTEQPATHRGEFNLAFMPQ